MTLSSIHLDAFLAVARTLNFSRAAESVHVTQSALSQRIKNLERELQATLFIRDPKNIRLTEVGTRLLRHAQARESLELEFIKDFRSNDSDGLTGLLRVSGYSTTMQSMVLPTLAPLLRNNPRIEHEFQGKELHELPTMLLNGRADFIILDRALRRPGIESQVLGQESYVLIESNRFTTRRDLYLDHTTEDETTEKFLHSQGRRQKSIRRSYLNDIYAILEGVELGLGLAVVPKHLIRKGAPVRIVKGYRPMTVPVILHYFHQPFYTKLHETARQDMITGCKQFLL